MRTLFHFLLMVLGLSFSRSSFAQVSECSSNPEDGVNYCVELPLYCRGGVEGVFRFGIDPDSFDIAFTATFPEEAPAKALSFYAVDGSIAPGLGNSVKVRALRCSGTTCSGTVSDAVAEELESRFDFDQAVINVALRRGKQDVCLGKFTNNAEKLEASGALERKLCDFQPLADENYSGEGFFDPFGFGEESEGLFHMAFYGFQENSKLRACKLTGGKYREFFSFKTAADGEGDAEIYGRKLSDEEEARLAERPDLYSYDFQRSLETLSGSSVGVLLTKNLSAIFNQTIGSSSASKAMKDATKARRARQRQKRQDAKRRSLLHFVSSESSSSETRYGMLAKARKTKQDLFSWLQFDPSFGSFYVAPNCRGDVPSKAYGILSCNERAGSSCFDSTSSDSNLGSARACLESRESYRLLTVRLQSDSESNFQICINGTLESEGELLDYGRYAEGVLTSSSSLAQRVEGIGLSGADLSAVSSLGLSRSGNCSSPDFVGSPDEKWSQ